MIYQGKHRREERAILDSGYIVRLTSNTRHNDQRPLRTRIFEAMFRRKNDS